MLAIGSWPCFGRAEYVFPRRGRSTATAPVQFGRGPHGKLPARQFTTHIATLVVAGDACRAAPCSSPGCAPMYSRHAARSSRPSNLRLCLINRQHDARYFGGSDRYWQCAKNRSGRSHRAGKHGFLVKGHHGCSPFGMQGFWERKDVRMPNVRMYSFSCRRIKSTHPKRIEAMVGK